MTRLLERNKRIAAEYDLGVATKFAKGKTSRQLADEHGISQDRIRRITKMVGYDFEVNIAAVADKVLEHFGSMEDEALARFSLADMVGWAMRGGLIPPSRKHGSELAYELARRAGRVVM